MVRWLDPVARALDGAERPVPVFFRDDDAGWRDDRLRVLLDRFEAAGLPLDVAVIPQALGPSMARELLTRDVALHQHGLSHANHETVGRKHEFGPSRPRDVQRADIEAGRELLRERLGDGVEPIFTPPWNRCTADTAHCLAELGFAVLSRESRAAPLGLLPELDVALDWCRLGPDAFAAGFAAARAPVGVMLHHAEMDDDDMDRAGALLELVAAHEGADVRSMMSLV